MTAKIYQFPVNRRSVNIDRASVNLDTVPEDLAAAVAGRPGWQLVDPRQARYGDPAGWHATIREIQQRDGKTRWLAVILHGQTARYARPCSAPAAAVTFAEQLPHSL